MAAFNAAEQQLFAGPKEAQRLGLEIRAFLAGMTVLAFGSAAQAQFGVPGGIAPYAIINAPAAATASGGNCYWQPKGHGGGQNECPTPSPTARVNGARQGP